MLKRFFSIKSLGYAFEESKFDKFQRQLKGKPINEFPWSFEGIESREPNLRLLADRMLVINKIRVSELLSGL